MNLPFRPSEREKKFLIIGGVIVVLIVCYHLYGVYENYRKDADDLIEARILVLEKQLRELASRETLGTEEENIRRQVAYYDRFFLQGNKPPVAAAELQNTIKNVSSSLNVEIRVERALNPIESDFYVQIPVEVGFVTSTDNLRLLLEKLRQSPYLITISEMKVRVMNINKPEKINVTLIVNGLLKKGDTFDSEKEETKNVA